jgi:hypothetical protein
MHAVESPPNFPKALTDPNMRFVDICSFFSQVFLWWRNITEKAKHQPAHHAEAMLKHT